MAFQEDLADLYYAFHDRFNDKDKKQKLIKCQICCIEGIPSHSKNSSVCEMCFEDDFWDKMEEIKESKTAMLWALKTSQDGLLNGCYYPVGSYLKDAAYPESAESLNQAHFFQTKNDAEKWLIKDLQAWIDLDDEDISHKPKFKIVQITVAEV